MTAIPVSERKNWIGASEVAALFGVSKSSSRFQLWHEKAGNIPAVNLDRNPRVMAGKHFEAGIAALATDTWHWPLLKVADYSPHATIPRFGASLDFMAVDGSEPVETKWIDFLVFRDEWDAEGDVILDAPPAYLLQVQSQLACRPGVPRGWLVPCVAGNRIYRMEIPRHEAMIERIEEEVAEFWQSIADNNPPVPDFQTDADTISRLYHGKGGEVADLRANPRASELAAEYLSAHEVEKEGKDRKEVAMAELKTLLNDARGALINGYSIKSSHIKEATIVRKEHFRFNIRATVK